MEPEIIERNRLILAGIANCGKSVTDIDIHGLWGIYEKVEKEIPHRIDGKWYELHIGNELGYCIYCVIAGVEIDEVGDLPISISLRIIPAGKYAHFAYCMKDGGFKDAFDGVEAWRRQSGTLVEDFGLQLYDRDFNPKDENSILHIYIPLKR